jgi:enoyl-CoA hydratase/carnithine racemase
LSHYVGYPEASCQTLTPSDFVYLKVLVEDHVLRITLNRPHKRNAFDAVLTKELAYALCHARYSSAIWAVVLAAEGPVFCAGADLKAFAGMGDPDPGSNIPEPPSMPILGDLFRDLHKPCIARVHGDVFAGGFLMIGGCTHVLAAEGTRFGLPEVKRGIWPFQVMATLAELMPARQLLDWCMRGAILNAEEAQARGLVSRVVPADALDAELDALLADITAQSPSAIRLGLEAWYGMAEHAEHERHRYLHAMLQKTLQTEDAQEGLAAFREKRAPVWKGR